MDTGEKKRYKFLLKILEELSDSESLDNTVTETFDSNEMLKLFKSFRITAIKLHNDELLAINDERSHVF